MKLAIFAPFLYPFHIDMQKVLCNKVETRLFTCGIYGNYPFKESLKHAEVLESINLAGSVVVGPLGLIKFLRYKPNAVIIFGIENLAGLTIYIVSNMIRARVLAIVEENNITLLNDPLLNFLQKFKRQVVRLVYSYAHVLIAETRASEKYILDILRVKRKRSIVVRVHGVNTERYLKFSSIPKMQAKMVMLRVLGLPESLLTKKWCTFIGEPSYCKGADVLLDAIEVLQKVPEVATSTVFLFPNMRLLRDKEELKKQYEQKLKKLIANGLINLYGLVKLEHMPILYRASDVIVLPSRFLTYTSSDRSPNVALEALASGNILVASYAGGIPTIVGDAAILIRPNDPYVLAAKLRDILINYEKYKHLEKKARERALYMLDMKCYVHDMLSYLKLS
jgi:glycosyltransferase involved in cell wall biosynthesis